MKHGRTVMFGVGAAALALGALWWQQTGRDAEVRIVGQSSALPRATAESEFLAPEALEAARTEAERLGLEALIVHRHGHRVFEYFAPGRDGSALLDGGELAASVLDLTLSESDETGPGDKTAQARLVAERLWLPLRAGDAWLGGPMPDGPRRCCIRARLDDWMRVGDLILGGGAYLGERFVPADAIRALHATRAESSWEGDEPLLAREGMAFDLAPGARLWLAPRRALAVLVWADARAVRNTLVPNIILRGLADPSPAIGGAIDDIVPGH